MEEVREKIPLRIKPLRDNVAIKIEKPNSLFGMTVKKEGEIFVVDKRSEDERRAEEFCQGEIVAIGPGWLNKKKERIAVSDIKVGDKVQFIIKAHDPHTFSHEGDQFTIVSQHYVIAKIG